MNDISFLQSWAGFTGDPYDDMVEAFRIGRDAPMDDIYASEILSKRIRSLHLLGILSRLLQKDEFGYRNILSGLRPYSVSHGLHNYGRFCISLEEQSSYMFAWQERNQLRFTAEVYEQIQLLSTFHAKFEAIIGHHHPFDFNDRNRRRILLFSGAAGDLSLSSEEVSATASWFHLLDSFLSLSEYADKINLSTTFVARHFVSQIVRARRSPEFRRLATNVIKSVWRRTLNSSEEALKDTTYRQVLLAEKLLTKGFSNGGGHGGHGGGGGGGRKPPPDPPKGTGLQIYIKQPILPTVQYRTGTKRKIIIQRKAAQPDVMPGFLPAIKPKRERLPH